MQPCHVISDLAACLGRPRPRAGLLVRDSCLRMLLVDEQLKQIRVSYAELPVCGKGRLVRLTSMR